MEAITELAEWADDQLVQEKDQEKDHEKSLNEQLEELKQQHYKLQNKFRHLKEELNTLLNNYKCEVSLRYDAESRYESSEFSLDLEKAHNNFYQTAMGIAKKRYAELSRRYYSVSNSLNSLPVFEQVEEVLSLAEQDGY